LLIGNGRYQHNATLANPPNDAADMAAALKKDGFTVTLLTDASRKTMEQAVRAFGNSLKNPDAVGMFYYSGHGAQADGENFLIPVDADIQAADELAYSAVDAESVLAKMRSAGNKINIVVLDACRDNPFPGSSRSAEKGLAVVRVKVPESVIVYATDPGSTASDGTGRNSPFTKAFLENMDVPGQDITQVMKRVTSRVQTETDGKQTPWVSTNLTKDFAFRSTPSPTVVPSVRPPAAPTITVTRLYGSLEVTTMTGGTLYLDGKAMGEVPAGTKAKLDSVEIGKRSLELHYPDGQVEQHTAMVEAETGVTLPFTYRKAPAQAWSESQKTHFFELAKTGTPQDVQGAIDNGADINALDNEGSTPLMYAAEYNNPDVVTTLLRAGADVNTKDKQGMTALMCAAQINQNPEVITVLLKAGADLKAQDNRMGLTPLGYAASNNWNPAVMNALLRAGVDINATISSWTALVLAAKSNPNPEVIMMLLKAGANAKAKDWFGRTALWYAHSNEKLKGTAALKQLEEASK
jgi:uncharacterized caspase-like protein